MSSTVTRPKVIIPSAEIIAKRQQEEDERSHFVSALSVRYQSDRDILAVTIRSGITMEIPRCLIDELAYAPQAT